MGSRPRVTSQERSGHSQPPLATHRPSPPLTYGNDSPELDTIAPTPKLASHPKAELTTLLRRAPAPRLPGAPPGQSEASGILPTRSEVTVPT